MIYILVDFWALQSFDYSSSYVCLSTNGNDVPVLIVPSDLFIRYRGIIQLL